MIASGATRKAGPYIGDGVTVAFPFTFKVFAAADLLVVQTDLTPVDTTQVLTSNYTVSLNANQDSNPGGSVTMLVAPPSGYLLTIGSQMANTQTLVLTNLGGFYPTVINDALDRSMIAIAQLAEKATRSLTLPFSSAASVSAVLPVPVASNFLGWNAAANAIVNYGGAASVPVTAAMAPVVGAATLAAARTAMGAAPTDGSQMITSINSGQLSGFRNKIINGDMGVSQVNGTTAVTPTAGSWFTDMWYAAMSQASKLTFQQVADAPAGFKYSAKISVAAQYAAGAAEFFYVRTAVEGQNIIDLQFGTATPATISCSLYVKGSVAGVYSCSIQNAVPNRTYVGTINVTTSWAKQTVVLVADTTGTWATDNTAGVIFAFDLGSGTNFNTTAGAWQTGAYFRTAGSVPFVNQVNGSTLNITGVQLEQVSAGATSGTAFEHVPYATQLRWCQRYLPCFNSTGNNHVLFTGVPYLTTATEIVFVFPVPTRVACTGFVSSAASTFSVVNSSGTNIAATGIVSGGQTSDRSFGINLTGVSGLIAGGGTIAVFNSASGQIYFTGAQM